MKLQRYTLAASTLILLAPCLAADNPFARWDKIQRDTVLPDSGPLAGGAMPSVVRPQVVKTEKATGSFEYFSANSAAQAASEESAGKVTLERLGVKKTLASPQPSLVIAAPATQVIPLAVTERIPAAPPRTNSSSAAGVRVMNAAFVEETVSKAIQQTSGVQFDELSDSESNPFANFLNEREAAEEETPLLPSTTDLEEPEFAAPVVNENSFTPETAETPETFVAKTAFEVSDTDTGTTAATQSGPQSPTVTLQWIYHGDFNVGQECRCELLVENTGQSIVRNVVTEAIVPDGIEVINSDPAPTASGGSATWSFGEMKPGDVRKVALTVIPRVKGELQMNAFVRVTGASSSSFSVRQPMIALKLDGPAAIEIGQMVNYTAIVTNPGTGEAKNVVIQVVVPDGMEHRRGKMLTIEIGTLNPGESRQARLSLTGTKGGNQKLDVRVVADGGLIDEKIDTVAIAEPRLNIGVRGPDRGIASQSTVYEVIVVNEGKVDSNNVRAKYRIPEGFDFVKADRGGKFNVEDRTIDWFVGTLGPGQVKNFNVTLQALASGEYRHQVGVISEHGRMTMAEHLTAVQGNAKLALTVASNARSVQTGAEVSFEIKIQNSGITAAESVGLSCELPTGLELVDISGPSEFIADSGVVIFRALPSIAGGESVVFIVKTRCSRPGNHSARVRVASETIGKALIGEQTITGIAR